MNLDLKNVFFNMDLFCMVFKNYCFFLGDIVELYLKLASEVEISWVKIIFEYFVGGVIMLEIVVLFFSLFSIVSFFFIVRIITVFSDDY